MNNYTHLELNIIAKSKHVLGNTVNYKNLAQWNNSKEGNVTSIGSNGNANYYGLFDISGQVYEWTETVDNERNNHRVCRGGCYADTSTFGISKYNRKSMHYNEMFNDGFFGFRVASNSPSGIYCTNLVNISHINNTPDNCENLNSVGSVSYSYYINKYLVTNEEYVEFLNTVDSSGLNQDNIYDDRMNNYAIGGISKKTCNNNGEKYILKPNMSNKPVTFVKWMMAAKFINWLNNNKSSDSNNIYNGTYNLENLSDSTVRNSGAIYYLPTEDEWYKAAYYDPNKNNNEGYWIYGTKSDNPPLAIISNNIGDAIHPEGYYYNNKKFPIIINRNVNNINTNNNKFNINFQKFTTDNTISLSGNLCCQPIPILIQSSGHIPGEIYEYKLSSLSPDINIFPSSGLVSFGSGLGKLTSFVGGISNTGISVLEAQFIQLNNPEVKSIDQVLLRCLSNCSKSCDNRANFKSKAIWGICYNSCVDKLADGTTYTKNNVTTVGTNGGPSSYGAYDMDGNIWEVVDPDPSFNTKSLKVRGGCFNSNSIGKMAVSTANLPEDRSGFRIGCFRNIKNYPNFISIEDIGSPITSGNKEDSTGFGKVPYNFKINQYPVTNCEYAEFLNKIASTGFGAQYSNLVYNTNMAECYGGIRRVSTAFGTHSYLVQNDMDSKPVRHVSEYGIYKYINWLNNDKPDDWQNSNTGVYILNNNSIINRQRSFCDISKDYFLPSENEWYKAAYYKGANTDNVDAGYWNYATQASYEPDPVYATNNGDGIREGCDNNIVPNIPCGPAPTRTMTPIPSITPTQTPTQTATPTVTPTQTSTQTPTPTPTPTLSPNPDPIPAVLLYNPANGNITLQQIISNSGMYYSISILSLGNGTYGPLSGRPNNIGWLSGSSGIVPTADFTVLNTSSGGDNGLNSQIAAFNLYSNTNLQSNNVIFSLGGNSSWTFADPKRGSSGTFWNFGNVATTGMTQQDIDNRFISILSNTMGKCSIAYYNSRLNKIIETDIPIIVVASSLVDGNPLYCTNIPTSENRLNPVCVSWAKINGLDPIFDPLPPPLTEEELPAPWGDPYMMKSDGTWFGRTIERLGCAHPECTIEYIDFEIQPKYACYEGGCLETTVGGPGGVGLYLNDPTCNNECITSSSQGLGVFGVY